MLLISLAKPIPTHTRRVTDEEERRGEERGMEEERRDSEKLTLSLSYRNTHVETGAKRGGGGVGFFSQYLRR